MKIMISSGKLNNLVHHLPFKLNYMLQLQAIYFNFSLISSSNWKFHELAQQKREEIKLNCHRSFVSIFAIDLYPYTLLSTFQFFPYSFFLFEQTFYWKWCRANACNKILKVLFRQLQFWELRAKNKLIGKLNFFLSHSIFDRMMESVERVNECSVRKLHRSKF